MGRSEFVKKTIVILSTLDTRGEQTVFLKTLIQKRGHRTLLVDLSTGNEASIPSDVSAGEVARFAGEDIREIRKMKDTGRVSSIMIGGAVRLIKDLL